MFTRVSGDGYRRRLQSRLRCPSFSVCYVLTVVTVEEKLVVQWLVELVLRNQRSRFVVENTVGGVQYPHKL